MQMLLITLTGYAYSMPETGLSTFWGLRLILNFTGIMKWLEDYIKKKHILLLSQVWLLLTLLEL